MQNFDPNTVTLASVVFTVPPGATSLTAYEFCNLHGLWQGPTVNVSQPTTADNLSGSSDEAFDGNKKSVVIAGAVISLFVGACALAVCFRMRRLAAQKTSHTSAPANAASEASIDPPVPSPRRLDAAIDAALAAQKGRDLPHLPSLASSAHARGRDLEVGASAK